MFDISVVLKLIHYVVIVLLSLLQKTKAILSVNSYAELSLTPKNFLVYHKDKGLLSPFLYLLLKRLNSIFSGYCLFENGFMKYNPESNLNATLLCSFYYLANYAVVNK